MGDGDDENLRWILERQKSDYTETKKQARRYILALFSAIIILLGIAFRSYSSFKSREELANNLIDQGLLWKTGFLSHNSAEAFVNSFIPIPAIFAGFGSTFIFFSIRLFYSIEQSSGCQPTGNAEALLKGEYETVREWIKNNDKLVKSNEEQRNAAMDLGLLGISLILLAILQRIFMDTLVLMFFLMLFYSVFHLVYSMRNDERLHESKLEKGIIFVLLFLLANRPVAFFQEYTGYGLSGEILSISFAISLFVPLAYIWDDLCLYLDKMYERIKKRTAIINEYVRSFRKD